MLELIEIIGYCAMTSATLIYFPLIYKIVKSKSVESISYVSLCLEIITDVLWFIYALENKIKPLMYSSIILFSSALLVIYFKYKYRKKEKIEKTQVEVKV